jgi:hypothetical protein
MKRYIAAVAYDRRIPLVNTIEEIRVYYFSTG